MQSVLPLYDPEYFFPYPYEVSPCGHFLQIEREIVDSGDQRNAGGQYFAAIGGKET